MAKRSKAGTNENADQGEVASENQLAGFIAKFTPEIAEQVHEVLPIMRARLRGAIELVYDNYNALAIGFGPSERASEAIFSIAVFPRHLSLFFLKGVGLPDPDRVLKGSGKVVRHIVLKSPRDLESREVKSLMKAALQAALKPLDPAQPHRIVIKSISAKQRPRRPAGK
jgi:hypothetical protein